jgi:hypothetical protein
MTDLEQLFDTVDQLTPDELKRLYTYILENHIQFKNDSPTESQQPRVLGLHAHLGEAWMSDDFQDELPDSFWLGEA